MTNKKNYTNGYACTNLYLPSGTLWATCNVGASKPSEYGKYFQWGDTKGYTKEQVGKDKKFTWMDYKFSINENGTDFNKYTKDGETLNLKDDAVHINMGGDWHMPSPKQIRELIENTISVWTTLDDVNGMKFISQKDASKFIFIPAAGYAWDGSVQFSECFGYVWSSMRSTYYTGSQGLDFDSEGTSLYDSGERSVGMSVRGVIG